MAGAFIGREAQRRHLIDRLAAAARQQPVTVLIEGDAGVGKTRLVKWFADEAAEQRATVLAGACIELHGGTSIPYGALIEAVRLFVRSEGPDRAQHLLGRSWPALARLTSDFTDLLPTVTTPEAQPQIFGALLRLADQLGRRAPLVLLFEDIHCADNSTLDLIRFLTRAATNQKLVLVCSHRPVATAVRHPLQALLGDPEFQRRVERLPVAPFRRHELDAFVTALAGERVPEDRLRRYFALSDGNAYYAEQLVTSDDSDNPEVQVPQSLRALMMARINQLEDEAAEVARTAAVAGRQVSDELLQAVTSLDEVTLERALQECMRRRVLLYDSADDAYTFEHPLLHQTTYQEIPPRVRKRLHTRIAEALAARSGASARLMPEVADHWFAAGRLAEAFAAAVRAAQSAARVHAFADAQAMYARVLRLWPDITDAPALAGLPRDQVLSWAADAARWAGDVAQALDWIKEAISEAGAEPARAGELHERLGSHLWEAGRHERAAAAYAEAERWLAGRPPSALGSRVQAALATAAIRAGDYPAGLARAQRAVTLARAVRARAEEGRALNSMGLALTFLGRADQGEAAARAALAIAAETDHLEDLLRGYGNLGVCLEHVGRLADVVTTMTEALDRAKDHGLLRTRQAGVLANNAAAALSSLGRYREAAALLDDHLLNRPVAESRYLRLTRAEVFVAQGEGEAAQRLLTEIGDQPVPDPRFIGPLYCCLAEVAICRNKRAEVRSHVEKGLKAVMPARSPRVIVQMCAIGLRAAADLRQESESGATRAAAGDSGAAQAGPGPAIAIDDQLTGWADELMATAASVVTEPASDRSPAGDPPPLTEEAVLISQCVAERARLDGKDTPEMWAAVVDGWTSLDRPLRRAYAWCRQSGAYARAGERPRAAAVARQAHALAEEIGAEPMREQIAELAARLRLRLGKPRPYDLTAMELRVLGEVTIGRTNAEIGRTLHISPKTASVHVSAILAKLGVPNRVAAADLARRERLVAD